MTRAFWASSPRARPSRSSPGRSTAWTRTSRTCVVDSTRVSSRPNDVLSAEAQESRARLRRHRSAQRQSASPPPISARLLGDEGDGGIEPRATLGAARPSPDGSPRRADRGGTRQRPERRALEDRADASEPRSVAAPPAARSRKSASAAASTTRVRTRASFRASANGTTRGTLSVNVSWPLWDGGRRRAEYAEAPPRTRAAPGRGSRTSIGRSHSRFASGWLEVDSSRAAVAAADDGRAQRHRGAPGRRRTLQRRRRDQHRRARRRARACCRPSSIAPAHSRMRGSRRRGCSAPSASETGRHTRSRVANAVPTRLKSDT